MFQHHNYSEWRIREMWESVCSLSLHFGKVQVCRIVRSFLPKLRLKHTVHLVEATDYATFLKIFMDDSYYIKDEKIEPINYNARNYNNV